MDSGGDTPRGAMGEAETKMHRVAVNGVEREVPQDPDRTLLVALREELGVLGPKYGCAEGECGACTVLLDGDPVRSCIVPLAEAAGRSITTVEGLAAEGSLHPAQRAFAEVGAMQCGYCTAGMIVTAAALLEREPDVDEAGVRRALNGNLCRCGAHNRIVRAVLAARPSEQP